LNHFRQGAKVFYSNLKYVYGSVYPLVRSGKPLERKDLLLFQKTKSDALRLIPFGIYFTIPGSALLLPVVIKLVPQIIPSPFWTAKDRERMELKKEKRASDSALELQRLVTMRVQSLIENPSSTPLTSDQLKTLPLFMKNIAPRLASGDVLSLDDLNSIRCLFEGPLSLKALEKEHSQILGVLAKVHDIGGSIGSWFISVLARFHAGFFAKILRRKGEAILRDDALIRTSPPLTEDETRETCSERGIKSFGVPHSLSQRHLQMWLLLPKNPPIELLLFAPWLNFPARNYFLKENPAK